MTLFVSMQSSAHKSIVLFLFPILCFLPECSEDDAVHFVTSSGRIPKNSLTGQGSRISREVEKATGVQAVVALSSLGLLAEIWEMDIPQTRVISQRARGCHSDQPRGTCGLGKEGGDTAALHFLGSPVPPELPRLCPHLARLVCDFPAP